MISLGRRLSCIRSRSEAGECGTGVLLFVPDCQYRMRSKHRQKVGSAQYSAPHAVQAAYASKARHRPATKPYYAAACVGCYCQWALLANGAKAASADQAFRCAATFNEDIRVGSWNVARVAVLTDLLECAVCCADSNCCADPITFNVDIGSWNVASVTSLGRQTLLAVFTRPPLAHTHHTHPFPLSLSPTRVQCRTRAVDSWPATLRCSSSNSSPKNKVRFNVDQGPPRFSHGQGRRRPYWCCQHTLP